MLIYIILSYSITAKLAKQIGKKNLIKTEVHNIHQLRLTPEILNSQESTNLVIKQSYSKE